MKLISFGIQVVLFFSILSIGFIPPTSAQEGDCLKILDQVFGKKRLDYEDSIFFKNNDVAHGKVLDKDIEVYTCYGNVKLELGKCAGISFEESSNNKETIVTVNRNRFSGIVKNTKIKFILSSISGMRGEFRKESIKYIVFGKKNDELNFLKLKKTKDLFLMTNGDLLTGRALESRCQIYEKSGKIPLDFSEVSSIEMKEGIEDRRASIVVTKKNGDIVTGGYSTSDISIELDLGLVLNSIYSYRFRKVYMDYTDSDLDMFFR